MALRLTAFLRDAMLKNGSLRNLLSNCVLRVYTGAQPATAEAAPTGTLLCTYSDAGAALTREVNSAGTVTLNTGAAGSVDTLTVNALEIMGSSTPFNTSLSQTATDVANKINFNPKNLLFIASASGAVITITAKPGLGTLPNTWVVASTVTTITKTDVNMASGVNAANGLKWGDAITGILSKHPTQVWQGTAAATGTAGWCRFEAALSDAGGLDSTESIMRLDGAVATSGAELNMPSTSIVSAAVQTISSFSVTLPTA